MSEVGGRNPRVHGGDLAPRGVNVPPRPEKWFHFTIIELVNIILCSKFDCPDVFNRIGFDMGLSMGAISLREASIHPLGLRSEASDSNIPSKYHLILVENLPSIVNISNIACQYHEYHQ